MDVAPKGTVIKETQTYKMYQLINKLFYLEKVYDKKYKKDYDRITKEITFGYGNDICHQ